MASQLPQVRRRPTKAKRGGAERNSNVVRASVLETALELGFGQNSTVANWIFNNPLSEEPEDAYPQSDIQVKLDTDPPPDAAGATTPTLTSGSNSTSDESSSLNSPGNAANAAATTIQVHSHKPSVTEPPCIHFDEFPSDQLRLFSPFTLSPHDSHHQGTRGDSLGKLAGDAGCSLTQDDSLRDNPIHESPSPGSVDTGYTSEGQYLSKAKGGRAKDKHAKSKGNKGSKPQTPDTSKSGEKDGGYASDGGYLSASSNKSQSKSSSKVKSRAMAFFRRRPKKSVRGSDDEDEDYVPPVPAIPILPRPSSPKLLERRAAPSSPTRSGFSPLTLNLTGRPASPARRRVSKSPPPVFPRVTPPQQSDRVSMAQNLAVPPIASVSTPSLSTPTTAAAAFPLPPSMPGTPLSAASFPTTPSPSTPLPKTLATSSSRQHLGIPPPAPPPTLPLPQPPPSPSTPSNGLLPPLPATPSRRGAPTRPIPVLPTTLPLKPRRAASPFRPLLSPRTPPPSAPHTRAGESLSAVDGGQPNGKEVNGRQRSATTGFGSAPAFLQRKIQHGPSPSPRNPPPDKPLPPSPCSSPSTRPCTPIGSHSKFHEHFSSVSYVPSSQVLSTPATTSPSLSVDTLESSSGPSVRSSHISSTSDHGEELVSRDPLNIREHSRPTTSASIISESSFGQPISSTFGRSFGSRLKVKSHFSDRTDVSSSVYSQAMHPGNGSVTTLDGDDGDVDDSASKNYGDEDDDVSVYPSDDKTAGRRTMYLLEYGEVDENGDEIVIAGSHCWDGDEAPPPLPPLPPTPIRPGPGYF